MLKARMTIIPARFSRVTRLSRSIRLWMILNLGRAMVKTVRIRPNRMTTARAMVHHMEVDFARARITPPTPMMGA